MVIDIEKAKKTLLEACKELGIPNPYWDGISARDEVDSMNSDMTSAGVPTQEASLDGTGWPLAPRQRLRLVLAGYEVKATTIRDDIKAVITKLDATTGGVKSSEYDTIRDDLLTALGGAVLYDI